MNATTNRKRRGLRRPGKQPISVRSLPSAHRRTKMHWPRWTATSRKRFPARWSRWLRFPLKTNPGKGKEMCGQETVRARNNGQRVKGGGERMKGTMASRLGLAIASVLLAGSAWAQMPGGGPGPGPGMEGRRPPFERAFGGHGIEGRWWNNPKIADRLKLTDEQRKEFDNILLQHREKLIDLRANVEKAELEMEPLVRADQPDEGKILAQIDKVAQARAELEKANARYLLALRSKITPDQWKQLRTMRENHMDRGRDGGWGQGGQRPGMGGPGNQFHRQMPPPPGIAPQDAPAPAPSPA